MVGQRRKEPLPTLRTGMLVAHGTCREVLRKARVFAPRVMCDGHLHELVVGAERLDLLPTLAWQRTAQPVTFLAVVLDAQEHRRRHEVAVEDGQRMCRNRGPEVFAGVSDFSCTGSAPFRSGGKPSLEVDGELIEGGGPSSRSAGLGLGVVSHGEVEELECGLVGWHLASRLECLS